MTRRWSLVASALVAVAALVYIVARAVLVPLTYDEASSYYRYIEADAGAVFDFATATNHFLNTVLVRASAMLFGATPIALRLPNVLAGALYLAVAVAFARRAQVAAIGFAGAVLLIANPYLLDYFALSRGYGLAVALLTASVYALLRRAFISSLALAAAAVAANFASLPAFLAIVAIATVQLLAENAPQYAPRSDGRRFPWLAAISWLLVTGAFSWMVYSRERVLSPSEFLPMVVQVTGLYEDELAEIRVFRMDSTGRLREIRRRPGGIWDSGPVQDEWALRVTLPVAADRNLAGLDVTIGDQVFRRDRRQGGPWVVEDFGRDRVLISTERLRWQGNALHTRHVAVHTAVTMAAWTLLALVLLAFAKIPPVARRLEPAHTRAIIGALLAVAAVAAAPLYLLRRDGQLFFGGSEGLAADTFGSLATGLAYNAAPDAWWAMAATVLAVILLALPIVGRSRDGITVAALVGLVLLYAIVTNALFDVPFPTGRTALFLLPLLALLAMLGADAIASMGVRPRKVATTALSVAAAALALQFARVANVTHTADWRHDASTPAMLERIASDGDRPPAVVRVGVEWMFYPVARFYAERMSTSESHYDIIVLPGDGRPFDFIYAPDRTNVGRAAVVQPFPLSGATLVRPTP